LYDWHLNEKLGLQIPGEASPVIKNPEYKSWNKKMTLPQMAYGYEMQLTPLKMLTFYNAIANDGKYVAPIFVKEVKRLGTSIEKFQARVINDKICSDATLNKIQAMLEGVITEGTGKGIIYNPLYKVAGKTGTAQVADANKGYRVKRQYQASFCGYFPADNPKYSLIVVVNGPKKGYYAAQVAGPPFREIADKIYANDLEMYIPVQKRFVGNTKMPSSKAGYNKATQKVYKSLGIKTFFASNSELVNTVDTNNGVAVKEVKVYPNAVPDVTGMGLKDAVFLLGNAGLKPVVKGSGKVIKQSLEPGSRLVKGHPISIELK